MARLRDGMLLHHAGHAETPRPDLGGTRPGTDFGRGFYLSPSLGQARKLVPPAVRRAMHEGRVPPDFLVSDGAVTTYRFRPDGALRILALAEADIRWLRLVAANRSGKLFPELASECMQYDVLCGKAPNDFAAAVIVEYMRDMARYDHVDENIYIERILSCRLHSQLCFRTERSIQCLEFVGSSAYGKK